MSKENATGGPLRPGEGQNANRRQPAPFFRLAMSDSRPAFAGAGWWSRRTLKVKLLIATGAALVVMTLGVLVLPRFFYAAVLEET